MEGELPMLNCLLQHTLRSLCTSSDSSTSSKWVYAVFWRILPRNYPPPKWDHGGGSLDRVKGNKRNWILVWEDGYCDFYECERAGSGCIKGRFGADVFFKMSHEVYNYGEGLVGKVAADNSHKWVFRDSPNENDPGFISSWNVSIDPQPRAWEVQFNSGIQTIAIISVREGIIQLGSLNEIVEDLNLVISIQRKFSYLQSIPAFAMNQKCQLTGSKRLYSEGHDESPLKSIKLGYNSPQNGFAGQPPMWSLPPLLPSLSRSFGALLSKLPSVVPSYNAFEALDTALVTNHGNIKSTSQSIKVDDCSELREIQIGNVKVKSSCILGAATEERANCLNSDLGLEDGAVVELGFGPLREGEGALNLN